MIATNLELHKNEFSAMKVASEYITKHLNILLLTMQIEINGGAPKSLSRNNYTSESKQTQFITYICILGTRLFFMSNQ